jgi:hypothetical protein
LPYAQRQRTAASPAPRLLEHHHGLERPTPDCHRIFAITCPLRNTADWRELRDTDPAGWERAVAYDALVRHAGPAFGGRGLSGEAYVHFLARPLADVDLSTEEDRGQLSLFGGECQGMCGV